MQCKKKTISLSSIYLLQSNLIINFKQGQSPLSLAIASGNKDAIELLLKNHLCDPNLPLTNGNGSALCAISSTLYEHNWLPHERTRLVSYRISFIIKSIRR